MTSKLRYYKFYSQSYDICCENLWQNGEESIKTVQRNYGQLSDSSVVLESDVPHSEQTAGEKRHDHCDHCAFRVVAVVYVHA